MDESTGATDALDAIAAELYALPPADFTAARNARAAASAPALRAQLKTLRKPSVAAWAVNLLAREGQLADALELSAALRDAQDDLDAAELSRLGRQRRALVAALATQASGLSRDAGVPVSAAAHDEVEKTINAAVMDAAAAAAVMTARLVRSLEAGAFEESDLADAVGGSLPGAAPAPARDDLAERRARKAAEKAAREAERASNEAERTLAGAEAKLGKTRERADHLAERIDDLRRDLARLEADAVTTAAELNTLESERDAAASRARDAAKALAGARRALED
ncbi:transposase [Microbacterium sp. 2FI]|uniref:transposase n=1 Tax=Microbacterium sp. 2FI TaxID=2502193 RepID=UPI0010F5FDDA|nr:transposase [Microbacterium sp. 2FI]